MNVRPGIVSEEQAAVIKLTWWRWAKLELIAWAICFAIAYALFSETLASQHWASWSYWAIIGASLLLFSRLAIWATFIVAALIHLAFGLAGHPPLVTFHVINACIFAILLRSPLFLFFVLFLASSMRMAAQHAQASAPEEPTYDWQFDQNVFRDGRREPAFLRYPYYEDRPENRDRH
jgi:hypothetical protein